MSATEFTGGQTGGDGLELRSLEFYEAHEPDRGMIGVLFDPENPESYIEADIDAFLEVGHR